MGPPQEARLGAVLLEVYPGGPAVSCSNLSGTVRPLQLSDQHTALFPAGQLVWPVRTLCPPGPCRA